MRPLDHHMRLPFELLERGAAHEGLAKAAVAGVLGGAGGHEVPHAGEPHAGHGLSSRGRHDTPDLCDAARHDGGEGVVAKSQACADAARDRDDVLHGAAGLNASDVLGHVDAKRRRGHERTHAFGEHTVGRGKHGA